MKNWNTNMWKSMLILNEFQCAGKKKSCTCQVLLFALYLMLWLHFYDFQTNVKTSKPSFCCLLVGDEVLHHRDKHADWGTATGKKRYTRAACEVPITSCEVHMINPALQIVAEGDLVCAFPGCSFPAVETKDEWTYWGYYGVSPFSITIGAGWLW